MEKLTEELVLEEAFLDMFSQRGFLSRAYNGIVDAGKFEEFYDGIVQLSAELGSALDIQVCMLIIVRVHRLGFRLSHPCLTVAVRYLCSFSQLQRTQLMI